MRDTISKPSYNVALILDDMAERGWKPTHLAAATRVGTGRRKRALSDMTISRFLNGGPQTAPVAKAIAEALGHKVKRYLIRASVEQVNA